MIANRFRKIFNKSLGSSRKNLLASYSAIDGWLTPAEAHGLFEIAGLLKKNAVVLEIGSWKGKSTFCIAQGLKHGIINCIDPFNAAGEEGSKEIYEKTKGEKTLLEQFKTNLIKIPSSVKIKTFQGYSHEFVGNINNIDFLFIDGDHSIEGCRYDFENYENEINIGGYLAFHDYDATRPELGPTWVIDNLVKKNPSYRVYKSFDSLTVFKKI